jgi:hypothetical protein
MYSVQRGRHGVGSMANTGRRSGLSPAFGNARMRSGLVPRVDATGNAWTAAPALRRRASARVRKTSMRSIVWLVGAVVIVLFVLSFLGLR